jgi:hypothetical protein
MNLGLVHEVFSRHLFYYKYNTAIITVLLILNTRELALSSFIAAGDRMVTPPVSKAISSSEHT